MEKDKDTQQILTEADHVRALTDSEGWKSVKGKLDARILDLQNINNLDMADIGTLPAQLAARKMAVDILFLWLKSDVYGFVEQQQQNNEKLTQQSENFIGRE